MTYTEAKFCQQQFWHVLKVWRPRQHHEGQGGLGPEASTPDGRGTSAARTGSRCKAGPARGHEEETSGKKVNPLASFKKEMVLD